MTSPSLPPADTTGAPGSRGKLAQLTAKRIEADIIRRRWPVGALLGSEAELREHYGVSRAVLREAIRLTEHHQAATMRRGPAGGLVVRAPEPSGATQAMVIYLESVGTNLEDLIGARLLLEPLAVALAIERVDEQGIEHLRAVLAADDSDLPHRGKSGHVVHVAIGELSGNPAVALFIEILAQLTERYSNVTNGREHAATSAAIGHDGVNAHRAVVEAIIGGDVARAQFAMRNHLEALGAWLADQAKLLSYHARPSAFDNVISGDKLAEVVAERIRQDIRQADGRVGDVLGSETILQDRYAVSRSVLREAIRLLEYHSIAQMRRGPGGGLVVSAPDAEASVETMSLYLDYRHIEVRDLLGVQESIELGCVDNVAARINEPGVADRLRGSLLIDEHTPESDVLEAARLFHAELADLSGNPILELFLKVLLELWVRHSAALPVKNPAAGPRAPELAAVHAAIVDALLANDCGLAKNRLRRYLRALGDWWQA
ncbi:FadR/GntR family transcriptional regulator [Mycobacterium seoulense]|uniref:FadR/GntR family transcriptional regulator n=1 Tax=Mycobacterium seoulense TaxID=386911 RepID=UPI003CF2A272